MEERLQHDSRAKGAMGSGARAKGLVLGLIAGLVAIILIDLLMMGYFLFTGHQPMPGSPSSEIRRRVSFPRSA